MLWGCAEWLAIRASSTYPRLAALLAAAMGKRANEGSHMTSGADLSPNLSAMALDTVRGEFVALRPLSVSDADVTHEWRHAERAAYLNQSAATVEDQARWIAGRPASELNYIIELASGAPVGMLSLVSIDLA